LDKTVTQYPILFIETPTFIYNPITENEVECVIKNLKGKFSAGYDEIPKYVVKQCARLTLNAHL
jgi:hypothetical protein